MPALDDIWTKSNAWLHKVLDPVAPITVAAKAALVENTIPISAIEAMAPARANGRNPPTLLGRMESPQGRRISATERWPAALTDQNGDSL
jgi:hypothetical protein